MKALTGFCVLYHRTGSDFPLLVSNIATMELAGKQADNLRANFSAEIIFCGASAELQRVIDKGFENGNPPRPDRGEYAALLESHRLTLTEIRDLLAGLEPRISGIAKAGATTDQGIELRKSFMRILRQIEDFHRAAVSAEANF